MTTASITTALTTVPSSVALIEVLPGERVSLRTLRLSRVPGRPGDRATKQVFRLSYGADMLRIAATARIANEVIEHQAVRYRAHEQRVDKGVGCDASAIHADLAVGSGQGARPQPASRHGADVDFDPSPFGDARVTPGTIVHIDSTQSVTPRGVSAPAGPLPVIIAAGGGGDD